jgi:hypothetical protein
MKVWSSLIAAVSIVVIALVVGGCGSTSGGKYEKHGVSFQIPEGWKPLKAKYKTGTKDELWSTSLGPRTGLDLISLTAYSTSPAITADNISSYQSSIVSFIEDLAKNAGGSVTDGPTSVTMGGLPGYRFEISFTNEDGDTLDGRIIMVFNGKTEYYLYCQRRSDSSRAAEIESGCDSISDSFELTGA